MKSRRNEIFKLGSGGSRTPILNKTDFENLTITLPPLSEQKDIASVLGDLDDKIELNRQMNETLEAMAQALFKSWFIDFDPVKANAEGRAMPRLDPSLQALFPASFEPSALGEMPAGWHVDEIGNTVKVVGGGTPSTNVPEYWKDGTFHWTSPKDLADLQSPVLLDTERKITELGLSKVSSGLLPKGTVLLSSRAPIGYLAIAEIPVAINQGYIAMVCDKELTNHYVLLWAKANMDIIESRANGTTFLEVSKKNFRPIPIVVPESKVMNAFQKQVAPLFEKLTLNLQESYSLGQIRDVLLPKLTSGEITLADAESKVEALV